MGLLKTRRKANFEFEFVLTCEVFTPNRAKPDDDISDTAKYKSGNRNVCVCVGNHAGQGKLEGSNGRKVTAAGEGRREENRKRSTI